MIIKRNFTGIEWSLNHVTMLTAQLERLNVDKSRLIQFASTFLLLSQQTPIIVIKGNALTGPYRLPFAMVFLRLHNTLN